MWSKKKAQTAHFEHPSRNAHELILQKELALMHIMVINVRPRQMQEYKRSKRGRNKTTLPVFFLFVFLSFIAPTQTNVVSGAFIN